MKQRNGKLIKCNRQRTKTQAYRCLSGVNMSNNSHISLILNGSAASMLTTTAFLFFSHHYSGGVCGRATHNGNAGASKGTPQRARRHACLRTYSKKRKRRHRREESCRRHVCKDSSAIAWTQQQQKQLTARIVLDQMCKLQVVRHTGSRMWQSPAQPW